jgi:hypothetical protein
MAITSVYLWCMQEFMIRFNTKRNYCLQGKKYKTDAK